MKVFEFLLVWQFLSILWDRLAMTFFFATSEDITVWPYIVCFSALLYGAVNYLSSSVHSDNQSL